MLHLGTPKTGTRSVQKWLLATAADLAAAGVDYPDLRSVAPGTARLNQSDLFTHLAGVRSRLRTGADGADAVAERLRSSGAETLLLSSEACWLLPGRSGAPSADPRVFAATAIAWLRRELGREVRLVVYLRRPDTFVLSLFNQYVKNGTPWSADGLTACFDRFWRDHLTYARYDDRIAAWREALGPGEFVVRPLEPACWSGGDLRADFAAACGFDPPALGPQADDDENRSWGSLALSVKFAANRDLDTLRASAEQRRRMTAVLGDRLADGSLLDLVGSRPILEMQAALAGGWEGVAERMGVLERWSSPWAPIASDPTPVADSLVEEWALRVNAEGRVIDPADAGS